MYVSRAGSVLSERCDEVLCLFHDFVPLLVERKPWSRIAENAERGSFFETLEFFHVM